MKLVDTNVLLYAVDQTAVHHRTARHWLDGALGGSAPVAFAWLSLIGFIRIATHPSIATNPLTTTDAMDIVDGWLDARSARVLHPGARHAPLLRSLLDSSPAGNLTNDAHLAALALEHRATMVSYDRDFERFAGLRVERPT